MSAGGGSSRSALPVRYSAIARRPSGVTRRAGIIIDLALMEYLGFVLASIGLFWLTARAFDARHPLRDGICAVATSLASYFVFARLLDLSLPPGVLAHFL